MANLHFELVTPDRLVMSDDVYMVVVPGTEGESGIMAGHAPYMTTLKNGDIAVYRSAGGQPERIPVNGGFAEVSDKGLTVLAESAGAGLRTGSAGQIAITLHETILTMNQPG